MIFLGIVPLALVVLFLAYYSRHNALGWWRKPNKSYVHWLPCNHSATTLSRMFQRLTSRKKADLGSLNIRQKAAFVSGGKADSSEPVYETIQEVNDVFKNVCVVKPCRVAPSKLYPVTKAARKITKDDIKVHASGISVEIVDGKGDVESSTELTKCAKKSKPKLEIIKTGLASTTNELIHSPPKNEEPRVYSIRNSGLYVSGKNIKVLSFKK